MHGRLYAYTKIVLCLFLIFCAPCLGIIPFDVMREQEIYREVKWLMLPPCLWWCASCLLGVHLYEKNEYKLFARAFRREVSWCLWTMVEEWEKQNPEQCTRHHIEKVEEYFEQGDEVFFEICKFRAGRRDSGTDWSISYADSEAAWRFMEFFFPDEYENAKNWRGLESRDFKYLRDSGYKPRHKHLIRVYVLDYFNLLWLHDWIQRKCKHPSYS